MRSASQLISALIVVLLLLPICWLENGALLITHRQWLNVGLVLLAYVLAGSMIRSFASFPGSGSSMAILPSITVGFVVVYGGASLLNFTYSQPILLSGLLLATLCRFGNFFWGNRRQKIMAFVPQGKGAEVFRLPKVRWIRLDEPHLPQERIEAIVVDLHSPQLDDAWQQFLAEQTLQGFPVYNVRQVEESLTGRVKIHHMYENNLGSLLPSPVYSMVKMWLDIVLVLLSLPLVLPIMLITAVAIKLDDGGPILFLQDRIGYRGKIIKVYKFRSMKHQAHNQPTTDHDERITRIGHFIRKTRIDELPQFFNVLKTELSLIGPRAEYKAFADELEKEVPFYQYRHIVRPGISGWAQVTHGHAVGAEETQVKIEHDFYYIKHFSFSLDMLIFFKTIKTMLTGFGAR